MLNRPHGWNKIYTAGKQQQQLAKDKFSRTDSQISVAFMIGHISVALLPKSVSFSSRVNFFHTMWSIWNLRVRTSFLFLLGTFYFLFLTSTLFTFDNFMKHPDVIGIFTFDNFMKHPDVILILIEKHICPGGPQPICHFRELLPTLPPQFFKLISMVGVLF